MRSGIDKNRLKAHHLTDDSWLTDVENDWNSDQGEPPVWQPSADPIGRFVYQEHQSFFRSRNPRSTHWSVVWSDLMMTMFIFFAVLFMYYSAKQEVPYFGGRGLDVGPELDTGVVGSVGGGLSNQPPREGETIERIFDVGRRILDEEVLRSFAEIDLAPDRTVRIVLTGDLLFDAGSAELKQAAKGSLRKIGRILTESPYMINVVGHTDNRPIRSDKFPTNWELSAVRATVVARFLIEEMKLPADRFYVTGHALYQPLRANNTPANRAANRRVEIIVTREVPASRPPLPSDVDIGTKFAL